MARRSLGTLTIDLIAKISGFETGMDKASRKAKKTSKDISTSFAGVAKAAKGLALAAAATATAVAAAGFAIGVKLVADSREAIDNQSKLAAQLRTTYESMETLRRAGDLAGLSIEQVALIGRQLELNLGKAAMGSKKQAEALALLGLSAREVAALPLDERIMAVNEALLANVAATERAAVAATLFGAKNALLAQQLDPGTIAEAARQARIFGTALSDIDAAQVEVANDAMSVFSMALKGVGDQITIQLAPYLAGLGDSFLNAAEAAGGMGTIIAEAFEGVVDLVIDVADAIALVSRAAAALQLLNPVDTIGRIMSSPGFTGQYDEAVAIFNEIRELATAPLPSAAFEDWAADAKKNAEDVAKSIVAARAKAGATDLTVMAPQLLGAAASAADTPAFPDIGGDRFGDVSEAANYINSTRTEVERLEMDIERVQELARDGFFVAGEDEEVIARLTERLTEAREKTTDAVDEISKFGEQAARNMQDVFADFLFDPFEGGLRGMADSFASTLQKMAAELIASQMLDKLGEMLSGMGGGAGGGAGGGSWASFLSGFGGARAAGGPVQAGRFYMVGENGPELAYAGADGHVFNANDTRQMLGGGGTQVFNISTPDANSFRASERQIARSARMRLRA